MKNLSILKILLICLSNYFFLNSSILSISIENNMGDVLICAVDNGCDQVYSTKIMPSQFWTWGTRPSCLDCGCNIFYCAYEGQTGGITLMLNEINWMDTYSVVPGSYYPALELEKIEPYPIVLYQ